MRDEHYQNKLAFRARGVRELERLVGGVSLEIERYLARRAPVRILELGCGYGTALLELRAQYGNRVQLHGLNRMPGDGDAAILARNARDRGILPLGCSLADWLPTLHYGDVASGLPFSDRTFDIVFSQVAWLYFGNKLAVLRDVMRVLGDDGVAKIDADELRPELPAEYARLVEIWDDGRLLPFAEYAHRFGVCLMRAPEGEYLHFGKCPGFADDVELVLELDVSRIDPHWDGVKCSYRTVAR